MVGLVYLWTQEVNLAVCSGLIKPDAKIYKQGGGRVRGDTPFCVDGGGGYIRALTEIWSFPAYVLQAQFVMG